MDYAKQLKQVKYSPDLIDWLHKQQEANNGLPCELLEIQSLKEDPDKCVGYRNKCEFTIGKIFWVLIHYYR